MQCSKISRLYECDFYPAVFFPTLIIAPYKTANIYVLLRKKQSLFLEAISTHFNPNCSPKLFSEVIDGYRLTSALLSTQDSSRRWSKSTRWRSASGPDTTRPMSSSGGSDAPSRRSQIITDAPENAAHVSFPQKYLYLYVSGFYVYLFSIHSDRLRGTNYLSLTILSNC